MPDPEDRIPDSPEEGSRAPPAGGRDSGERRAEPDRAARDADDRLRELTEQSLHLLDELAAARAALRAAEAVAEEGRARRVELEGRVAELQRQVRHSHTSRLLPAPSADAPPAFDTFLWIGDDTAAEDR